MSLKACQTKSRAKKYAKKKGARFCSRKENPLSQPWLGERKKTRKPSYVFIIDMYVHALDYDISM